MATLIDGKAVAAKVRAEVATQVKARLARGLRAPGLAVVRVGEDPASKIYVGGKRKACEEVGMPSWEHVFPETATQSEVLAQVRALNADAGVHGILVQLPIPKHLDEREILQAVDPRKDVDGFHPLNLGALVSGTPAPRACTPFGVMRLLKEAGVDPSGKRAVVIGRSIIVGKPMALLLLEANATVTVCHSKTVDLPGVVREADIVVAAIGKGRMVKGDWIKPGATVIDVGMNRQPDGKLWGDVDFEGASQRAAAITPVPGGVGPMTIAMLIHNTLGQAERFDTQNV
jgi:methylenetetrahydrofolate dehydrogenase (NADP+)/methenyltetrahydrofolate cyclohydrolase